jgi:hypothetical protein
MDETKHVIVFKMTYFEVVVSHGYFDLLTYTTYHSVIYRVLKSDLGNIFVQDTQRLENGNVRTLDIGIIHKITAHIDPSRRCGQPGDKKKPPEERIPTFRPRRKSLENRFEIVFLRSR